MKIFRSGMICGWLAIGVMTALAADSTNAPPAVQAGEAARIIRILQQRYVDRADLSPAMLDEASVAGILQALGRGAVVVSETSLAAMTETNGLTGDSVASVARSEVIEPNIGYLRFANINADATAEVDVRLAEFQKAKVAGYILDLRFADGHDYAAAAAVAGRFVPDGTELFATRLADQGETLYKASAGPSGAGETLADSPLLLLVNSQTRGSAEALAGGLRAVDRGILIGGVTAGDALAYEDVKLGDGRVLRVATGKVILKPSDPKNLVSTDLFPNGLAPDIYVPLELSVERESVLNQATNVTLTVSLQPTTVKKRMSEADLVKAFKGEAVESIGLENPDNAEDEIQEPRDTVLQRAVDVMKGIRVLLTWR